MSDIKLFKWLLLLMLVPVCLAFFGVDRFRYPCQNPDNWAQAYCQRPVCDVTRTCPDHIFKGQRDPRIDPQVQHSAPTNISGVTCAK